MSILAIFVSLIIIMTMLTNSISFLKTEEPTSSRRGVLIKMLKNAEKQAKNDEKIQFLTSCRKAKVTPSFIDNCLKSSIYVLGNDRGMRRINEDYRRRTMNETIKSAHRYRAFLLREHRRIMFEAQDFRLFKWTVGRSQDIYHEERMSSNRRLSKKFTNLLRQKDESQIFSDADTAARNHVTTDNIIKDYYTTYGTTGGRNTTDDITGWSNPADDAIEDIRKDSDDTDCWYDASSEDQMWVDATSDDDAMDCWCDALEEVKACDEWTDDCWYDALGDDEYNLRGRAVFCEEWFDAVENPHPQPGTEPAPTLSSKFTNLTSKSIGGDLKNLLEKGPNFALSRRITTQTMIDVEMGLERGAFATRWKEEIDQQNKNKHTNGGGNQTHTKPKIALKPRFSDTDTKQAPQAHPVTENALKRLKQKVMGLYSHHRQTTDHNHTKDDLSRLTELQKDDNVIVKRSDKCKGLVLMNKNDYVQKTEAIVKDYQPVQKNPTKQLDAETSELIKTTLKGKLPDKTIQAIKPNESRTAELYGLPKTHKAQIPMRPIVSACGDPLDKLSWLLERIITQLLVFVPAHLTNTYDYLTHLKEKFPSGLPKGAIAFTVDVNNLYGNIPTAEAIQSTIKMLQIHSSKVDLFGLTIPDVQKLLEHCLNNNYVRFGSNIFKQSKGIAMGSRIAPPLAILFMNTVESLLLATDRLQPSLYLRYIDDVFGIWTHGSASLDSYFDFLNSFHPALKFSIERTDRSPRHQIPFLDTLLTVHSSGIYTTELYIKPMAAPIIMHFTSCHPMQTKRAIIHSQSLRALRLGSDKAAQNRGMEKITNLFISNGYPSQLIRKVQNAARYKQTMKRPQTKNDNSNTTFISLPYIDETLTRKINAAVKSSDLNIRVAWKSGPTLSSKLIRSALEPPTCPRGNRKSCNTCDGGLGGKCHTKNVVYQITCKLCKGVYVGKTRRMVRTRFMEHLGDARNRRRGTDLGDHVLAEHQNTQPKNDDFQIEILHICKDEANLMITESIEIRNRRPALNKNSFSWRLLNPVPYTSATHHHTQ